MEGTKPVCAVICEYNPFHYGHLYQISRLKEVFSAVVCILGGNLSQRGEVAVADRYTRARAALECGADLVVELPLPWCCSSAREFAAGGVAIAKGLGVDALAFSAESDPDTLYAVARERAQKESAIRTLQKEQNLSYPVAAEQVLGKTLSGNPNDILAIEYLSFAGELPAYILRRDQSYRSSTSIRGEEDPLSHLPKPSAEVFAADPTFPRATARSGEFLLATLRNHPPKDTYGVSEELYASMTRQACLCDDYSAWLESCVNKMFTLARVRRGAWSSVLCFPAELKEMTPSYTLLLAANEQGRAFLKKTAKTRTLPVLSYPAEAESYPMGELNLCTNDLLRLFYGGKPDKDNKPYIKGVTP